MARSCSPGNGSRLGRVAVACGALALAACGSGDPRAVRPTCADPAHAIQFPTPYWVSSDGAHLAIPEDDALGAVLAAERPTWGEAVAHLDGLPARPTFFVALDGVASAVDASRIAYVGADGADRHVPFEARLDEAATTLVLAPRDPLPGDGILALRTGVVAGARAIPSCAPAGASATNAYGEAAAIAKKALADVELAMPVHLSTLPDAHAALAADPPPISVVSAEAVSLASLGEKAPPPDVAAELVDPTVKGILATTLYLDDGDHAHDGPDGMDPQGTTHPGFVVALPKNGSPPYPWVLFQHGGGGDKLDVFAIAGPFVERGIALVAIDLLEHGDRAAPGKKGTGAEYIDFGDPLRMRDMLRQTSADHVAVFAGVQTLNAALAPFTKVGATLDPERAMYLGHSLGGLSGGLTVGTAKLRAGALFDAGGDYGVIARNGYFSVLARGTLGARTPLEEDAAFAVLEAALDGADPLAFAASFPAAQSTSLVVMEAVGETVFANASTDALARAWGASIAKPADHSVEGMTEVDLPYSAAAGPTRALVENPMTDVPPMSRHGKLLREPYALELVARCFAGEPCRIEDTGFAAP